MFFEEKCGKMLQMLLTKVCTIIVASSVIWYFIVPMSYSPSYLFCYNLLCSKNIDIIGRKNKQAEDMFTIFILIRLHSFSNILEQK